MAASENLRLDDDSLASPTVRGWAETKYRLLSLYDERFSTGMKNKWDQRVYIDLYAGAGCGRVQGAASLLKGSPLLALTVPKPFDKYIFCEENEELLSALKMRVQRIAPQANAAYMLGKCDIEVDRICAEIPKGSATNKVLSLYVIDPFDFGLKFDTIRKLSSFRIDFVVLLAVGMDANRNYDHMSTAPPQRSTRLSAIRNGANAGVLPGPKERTSGNSSLSNSRPVCRGLATWSSPYIE